MNVASFELCRELHLFTGWRDTDFAYRIPDRTLYQPRTTSPYVPAYDLGYLLRKLPRRIDGYDELRLEPNQSTDGWNCSYDFYKPYGATADTPEDAAAKLAIQLFKEGVLS